MNLNGGSLILSSVSTLLAAVIGYSSCGVVLSHIWSGSEAAIRTSSTRPQAERGTGDRQISRPSPRDIGPFIEFVGSAQPSRSELVPMFDGLAAQDIAAFLRQVPHDFWENSAYATSLFRVAVTRLRDLYSGSPRELFRDIVDIVRQSGSGPREDNAMIALAAEICLQNRAVSRGELISMLKEWGGEIRVHVLRAATNPESSDTIAQAEQLANGLLAEAGFPPDHDLSLEFARSLARYAALADPDEVLLKKLATVQNTKTGAGFAGELIRTLGFVGPQRLVKLMSAYATSAPSDAAKLLLEFGQPSDIYRDIANSLDPAKKQEFLNTCLSELGHRPAYQLEAFAWSFQPTEMSEDLARNTASALLCGSSGGFTHWISKMPSEDAAKLLDLAEAPVTSHVRYRWKQNWLTARLSLPNPPKEDILRTLEGLQVADPSTLYAHVYRVPLEFRADAQKIVDEKNFLHALCIDEQAAIMFCEEQGPEFAAKHYPTIYQVQANTDPAKAADLLRRTENPELRVQLQEAIVKSQSLNVDTRIQSEVCLELVSSAADPSKYRDDVDRLVQRNADISIQAAKSFLEKLPLGDIRSGATIAFIQRWTERDPIAASEWIVNASLGSSKDSVIGALVAASHDDPEIAFANAAVIADPKLRQDAVRQVLNTWRTIAPDAVNDLLRKSPLPEADIALMEKEMNPFR